LSALDLVRRLACAVAALALVCASPELRAQQATGNAEVTGRVIVPAIGKKMHPPSVVVWLTAINPSSPAAPPSPGRFTLAQKNRMFSPHLLVVPVGSVVAFPNEDPFFHNVFSLFNGKRFDLGLYEAGTSRDVQFTREGVSYIFCNIHPEMSAVVIALSTPLFVIGDPSARFTINHVPAGDYEVRVWIEGVPQPDLGRMSRRIALHEAESVSLSFDASQFDRMGEGHLNKFGKPYARDAQPPY
jgi:plastocyanin